MPAAISLGLSDLEPALPSSFKILAESGLPSLVFSRADNISTSELDRS